MVSESQHLWMVYHPSRAGVSTGHKQDRAKFPGSLAAPTRVAASPRYKTMLGKIDSGPPKLQEEISGRARGGSEGSQWFPENLAPMPITFRFPSQEREVWYSEGS